MQEKDKYLATDEEVELNHQQMQLLIMQAWVQEQEQARGIDNYKNWKQEQKIKKISEE